jgi:hypothetical protein
MNPPKPRGASAAVRPRPPRHRFGHEAVVPSPAARAIAKDEWQASQPHGLALPGSPTEAGVA